MNTRRYVISRHLQSLMTRQLHFITHYFFSLFIGDSTCLFRNCTFNISDVISDSASLKRYIDFWGVPLNRPYSYSASGFSWDFIMRLKWVDNPLALPFVRVDVFCKQLVIWTRHWLILLQLLWLGSFNIMVVHVFASLKESLFFVDIRFNTWNVTYVQLIPCESFRLSHILRLQQLCEWVFTEQLILLRHQFL